MRTSVKFTALFLVACVFVLCESVAAQQNLKSYSQTRKLLRGMETQPANGKLKRLFTNADEILPDLILALDDPEPKVNLNAQRILLYLATKESLKALDDWKHDLRKAGKGFSSPVLQLLPKPFILSGASSDPLRIANQNKQVFKASSFNEGDVTFRLVAFNKKTKTALLQIVQGQVFTEGWHSVIRREGTVWYLISDNNIWVS